MDITKFHTQMSLIKSAFRIFGCVIALITKQWWWLALLLLVAEIIGILEEVDDGSED